MNSQNKPTTYFVCQNPECDKPYHSVPTLAGILLTTQGHVVFQLPKPIEELSSDELRVELDSLVQTARANDADDYADVMQSFMDEVTKPVHCEDQGVPVAGPSNEFYATAEYQALQAQAFKADIAYREAETAKSLAEARLINAQAIQIERNLGIV